MNPVVIKKSSNPIQVKGGEIPVKKFDYSKCKLHVVQDGEELFDIAERYHIAIQQLRYFNGLDRHTLAVRKGQKIYIPNKPIMVPAGK